VTKNKYIQICGFAGAICCAFGGSSYVVQREFSVYVLVNACAGLFLIGIYLYHNIKDVIVTLLKTEQNASRKIAIHTVYVLLFVVLVNLFSSLFYSGKDFTRDNISSISPHSQKVVQWIKEPLAILYFTGADNSELEEYLLESYHYQNKNVSYRIVDPERHPQLAQKYGIQADGQAVVVHKDGFLKIPRMTEEYITNALIRLTQRSKNTVYFLTGHGEHGLDDRKSNQGYGMLFEELSNENYAVRSLALEPPHYYIPADATILVVGGPRREFTEFEKKALYEYMQNNGRMLIMADPVSHTGLEQFVKEWGIEMQDSVLLDVTFPSFAERAAARLRGTRALPMPILQVFSADFPSHDITEELKDKAIILSVARVVTRAEQEKPDMRMTVQPLARTTSAGWAETDTRALFREGTASRSPDEQPGPHDVAMLAVRGTAESNSAMIVIGDSDFVNNEYLFQLYNRDFILNCLAYLSSQESLISVRARHFYPSRVDYDPRVMGIIFTMSVLIFPQLLVIAGFIIWWLRR